MMWQWVCIVHASLHFAAVIGLGCSVHRVLALLGHVYIGPRTALGVPTHCEQLGQWVEEEWE